MSLTIDLIIVYTVYIYIYISLITVIPNANTTYIYVGAYLCLYHLYIAWYSTHTVASLRIGVEPHQLCMS